MLGDKSLLHYQPFKNIPFIMTNASNIGMQAWNNILQLFMSICDTSEIFQMINTEKPHPLLS